MRPTAETIVRDRGRGYLYKGKYPQIVIFTTNELETDKLMNAFGGHAYQHGTGFTWVLSKRSELEALMVKIKPFLPSKNGFESVLLPETTIPAVTA
jgi:hypothetical protein